MSRCLLLLLLLLLLGSAIAASLRTQSIPRDIDLDGGLQYEMEDARNLRPIRSTAYRQLGDEIGWLKRDDSSPSDDQYDLGLLVSALRERDAPGFKRNPKTKSKPCYWSLVACF